MDFNHKGKYTTILHDVMCHIKFNPPITEKGRRNIIPEIINLSISLMWYLDSNFTVDADRYNDKRHE